MCYIFFEDKIAWKNSILHFLIYSRIILVSNHISFLHEYISIYIYHIIREISKKFPTKSNLTTYVYTYPFIKISYSH